MALDKLQNEYKEVYEALKRYQQQQQKGVQLTAEGIRQIELLQKKLRIKKEALDKLKKAQDQGNKSSTKATAIYNKQGKEVKALEKEFKRTAREAGKFSNVIGNLTSIIVGFICTKLISNLKQKYELFDNISKSADGLNVSAKELDKFLDYLRSLIIF